MLHPCSCMCAIPVTKRGLLWVHKNPLHIALRRPTRRAARRSVCILATLYAHDCFPHPCLGRTHIQRVRPKRVSAKRVSSPSSSPLALPSLPRCRRLVERDTPSRAWQRDGLHPSAPFPLCLASLTSTTFHPHVQVGCPLHHGCSPVVDEALGEHLAAHEHGVGRERLETRNDVEEHPVDAGQPRQTSSPQTSHPTSAGHRLSSRDSSSACLLHAAPSRISPWCWVPVGKRHAF
jgi:hypothetical protein